MTGDRDRDIAWTISREVDPKHPDGVTNYPWDPGGVTKYGIAQKYHPGVDVANLTKAGAIAIYGTEYWAKVGGDTLAEPLCLNLFDCAVNPGVGHAKQILAAIGPNGTWQDFLFARIEWYVDTVRAHPEKAPSLGGWIYRCLLLRKESLTR